MDYRALSDAELLQALRSKSSDERRVSAEILRMLREVERRGLYAEMGYPSMYEYCRRELLYSEGSAHRRISAMRLSRDLPEVEEKLKDGSISLSSAATLNTFFRKEAGLQKVYSQDDKRAILAMIDKKSHRETESVLAAISPAAMIPPESERPITQNETEIRFVVGRDLLQKFERLKSLLSHKNAERGYAVLFEEMANIVLKRLDPELKGKSGNEVAKSTVL